VKQV